MLAKAFLASCLSLLMVYLPVAPPATSAAVGQMTTRGTAEINGITAPTDTTVFAGDRIATRGETTAVLTMRGGDQVLLPSLSAATVARDESRVTISLEQGALAVLSKSKTPVMVAASGVRIQPVANAPAIYEVGVHGKALEVIARRGTALVETAGRSVEVKEGTELEATMAPPQGASPALGTFETWTIVAAAAAGVTGLALGVAAITRAQPQDCTVSASSPKIICP
jgi:hypothetical protein